MHGLTFTKDTRLEVKAMVDLKTLHTLQEIATYGLSGLRITPDLRDTIQELVCCLINPIRPLPEFTKPGTLPMFPPHLTTRGTP